MYRGYRSGNDCTQTHTYYMISHIPFQFQSQFFVMTHKENCIKSNKIGYKHVRSYLVLLGHFLCVTYYDLDDISLPMYKVSGCKNFVFVILLK